MAVSRLLLSLLRQFPGDGCHVVVVVVRAATPPHTSPRGRASGDLRIAHSFASSSSGRLIHASVIFTYGA